MYTPAGYHAFAASFAWLGSGEPLAWGLFGAGDRLLLVVLLQAVLACMPNIPCMLSWTPATLVWCHATQFHTELGVKHSCSTGQTHASPQHIRQEKEFSGRCYASCDRCIWHNMHAVFLTVCGH